MSVYWYTISAAYLIWSFLDFDWYMTWIIHLARAIVHKCIKEYLGLTKVTYEKKNMVFNPINHYHCYLYCNRTTRSCSASGWQLAV